MTGNEIIKALECCDYYKCFSCPLRRDNNCLSNLRNYAIDLINRQKEEIEKLKADVKRLTTENENLTTARTEAIKEFAGRVSDEIIPVSCLEIKIMLLDLVKEMTGENHGE